jgi:prophage DNA circulation protein
MADETRILQGFFKGVPIAIDSGSVTGGRKHAIKQFPSRDTQNVEDLGLQPRRYNLQIVINDKTDQDYFAYRDRLIAVLEEKGTGELIHPLYGRITDVIAVTYSLNERFSEFGDAVITVQFEVDGNRGIPQTSGNVVTQIATSNTAVQAAVETAISDEFTVTNAFTGNFGAATDKVDAIVARAEKATDFIGEAAVNLNEFNATLGELSANVNSLVSNPSNLGTAVRNLMADVNGLYASAGATFDTMVGFFGFGDDDTAIKQDTAGRIERKKNNDILNGAMNASSLGFAYLNAVDVTFDTTAEIDELTAELDGQFEAVQENGITQDVKDELTDMRVKVLEALDDVRVNTSQIITVETTPTSTRLLAFDYYGSDELGQELADLNNIADVSFVEGEVKVLTQ